MASGSRAGGAVGGEGSRKQTERGGGKGKDIASSSAPLSGVVDKVPTPATDPSLFVPQPEERQRKLQGEKEVWKHVEQGQEAAPKGRGDFTTFQRGGGAITEDDKSVVVPRGYEGPQPSIAAGREPVEEVVHRGKETAAVEAVGEDGDFTERVASLQQTTIKRWVDNATQKKLDVAWAEAMFRVGIAFQFLEFDTTRQLHDVYLEVANARPKVKLSSSMHIQTVMLEFIFMHIQKQVEPLTKCWDVTDCTFITDGSNDRRERPVMNFLAVGEQGAVLVTTVHMDGKKKTGAALAKLWEKIMREIGLHRINAICTNNAEVNKRAAQILERRMDPAVSRIPWVPCAAHCCSLLLRDINKLDWVKGTMKRGHTIVKFIRNHHTTNSFMMSLDSSLMLLRPVEVRFGSVYTVPEAGADTQPEGNFEGYGGRKECGEMEGDVVVKREAASESGSRVLHNAEGCLVDGAVEMMESLYLLLRRMDKDGTAPSNLVEYDLLMERMLAEVVLTPEQRSSVLEKVRNRTKMMQQPVHTLAFFLDPRRRDPKWLLDRNSALVQNTLRYLQRQIGGPWRSKAHVDILSDLREFHKRPTAYNLKQKDTKMWDEDAVTDADCISPSEWCATHGGDVSTLQAIAIKVMGMWSTATPAERNWSSMDLVHSKRWNWLNPTAVEKLVYIHWNMNLLRASKNLKDHHYVDLWAEFFESLPDSEEGDDPLLEEPEEEKGKMEEEQARERALTKLPKGWIPKNLEEDEEEHTDDSDLGDEIWKGKAPWSETSSEGEAEDSSNNILGWECDRQFRAPHMLGGQQCSAIENARPQRHLNGRRIQVHSTTSNPMLSYRRRTPTLTLILTWISPSNPMLSYHRRTHGDIDMDLGEYKCTVQHPIDADEAEANCAKAIADADREQVQRRMREEEKQRPAIPTRREMEKQNKKVGEHEPEPVLEMGQQEEEEEEEMGQQDEEEEHEMAHQAQKEEEMEDEEEEACMERREEEMEQDKGKGTDQQEEGLEEQHAERVGESKEEQQHNEMANSEEEPQQQQHASTTVYKRQKKTAQPAGSPENSPEFPDNVEGSQHDNLWVSRVGRKRKLPPVDDVPRPKLPRGRPRKNPTAGPATKPKKKKQQCKPRKKIVEDDPDSDSCSEQFFEDEGYTDD
ncbi:hypothetical protein CBR_g25872 [Chara braunii]|uniref:DUF659 domain-containing protein n=1 Tax=Chara braunii TaxID=69332 RepID=A0A388L6J8_CHABU|nr:hypothetical protein CBR_g25872 [Chara braunii]|eukprot:GBG77941.1 hypothetical protein CBR_g25872 [Chara braunii]